MSSGDQCLTVTFIRSQLAAMPWLGDDDLRDMAGLMEMAEAIDAFRSQRVPLLESNLGSYAAELTDYAETNVRCRDYATQVGKVLARLKAKGQSRG